MNDKDKELLAQYHHTISEQLNARLSESPKFFWLLIVVSTAYGYVLSNHPSCHKSLFVLVSLLVWAVSLWANWYLAALGYAFRFLQNIQHCVEHALKWNPRYVPNPSKEGSCAFVSKFQLLPGIYHPHAVGFFFFVLLDCAAFCMYSWTFWPNHRCCVISIGVAFLLIGAVLMYAPHSHYKCKSGYKFRDPRECDIYSA